MEAIRKAVWYVEAHFASPMELDHIAAVAGLSRFHFSRSFAVETGMPFSTYLRGRRLSEAARRLAQGAPDILSVALDVGYGSHEAFTRAFRDVFGVTPEQVRNHRSLDRLTLMEPYTMSHESTPSLAEPAVRDEGPILLAGIREYRKFEERAAIPGQWQRFAPFIGSVPGQQGRDAFGVCLAPSTGDEGFDYLTAVAVRSLNDLPEGLSGLRLARRRYAVFPHADHVSKIGATCNAIFAQWQPPSGLALASEPVFLVEHYGPAFDPISGLGAMQLWVPLKDSPKE